MIKRFLIAIIILVSVVNLDSKVINTDTLQYLGDFGLNTGEYIFYVRDKKGTLTLDDILKPDSSIDFKPMDWGKKKLKTHSFFWFRLAFYSSYSQPVYFKLCNADRITAFVERSGVITDSMHAGNFVEYSRACIPEIPGMFKVNLRGGEQTTIYAKVENGTDFAVTADVQLYDAVGYKNLWENTLSPVNMYQGLFQGAIWMLILYNFFLFMSSRDRTYLFYVFYMFGISVMFYYGQGMHFRFLTFFAEYPMHVFVIGSILNQVTGALYFIFMRQYMDTRHLLPRWDRVFRSWIWFRFITAPVIIWLSVYFNEYDFRNLFILFDLTLLSISVIVLFHTRKGIAYYFGAGGLCLSIGGFANILLWMDILPIPNSEIYIQLGILSELLLFSLGLGYKKRKTEEERIQIQAELLYQMKENEKIQLESKEALESKIAERTREIEDKKEEIEAQASNLAEINENLRNEILIRGKIENELRANREKLTRLMNAIPDMIYYKDKNGRYQGCNQAFERYFNLTETEIIGKTDFDILKTEAAEEFSRRDEAVMNSRRTAVFDEKIEFPDNSALQFEIVKTPYFDSNGEVEGIVSIAREITERTRIELALRKSEKQYKQLIETMNEGVAIIDNNGLLYYTNSKFCEMLQYTREELIQKPAFDFIDSNKPFSLGAPVVGESLLKYYEMEWLKKDGTRLITLVSPSQVFDDEGVSTGRLVILTDITLMKEIESEINNKNQELNHSNEKLLTTLDNLKSTQAALVESEKMASLGQLTAGIAHEINNPINFVSGNITPLKMDIDDIKKLIGLLEELESDPGDMAVTRRILDMKKSIDTGYLFDEVDKLLEGIEEGAGRTKDIVVGLRNFSRLDENDFKEADIHEGIESSLILLRNKIKNRVAIHKDYGGIPRIDCLPGKLNQVFMNILNNAQQAIDDDGDIYIKTWKHDDKVMISIKDNGRGMDEETAKHIFEPFFTTKDVGIGTGLGLSITFGIIEKHKGTIKVCSMPGAGSEFIITLPLKQEPDAEPV